MGKILVAVVLAALVYGWWRSRLVHGPPMRPAEARTLLGLSEGASLDDIRAAHRRLIAKVHPDAGGSAGLATRVNAARDALIEELKYR